MDAGWIAPFVGRTVELEAILTALESARAGRGTIVLVSGEPGIGKTRLAAEVAGRAHADGFRVASGGCMDGAPPYWPWQQLLRSLVRARSMADAMRLMGHGASVIAAMLPGLREQLDRDAGVQTGDDPVSGRHRFFDAVSTFLCRTSDEEPLLLVLEDVHWADTQSLELLSFLSYDIPASRMVILVTYRPMEVTLGNPFADTLGRLARMSGTLRVELDPFGCVEILALLRQLGGTAPAEGLAERLLRQTDGNPLFVVELVRTLPICGERPGHEASKRGPSVPESIRDVVRGRLLRVSSDCRRLLEVAAVVGREARMRVLETVLGEPGAERVLALVDEAVAAGFLEPPDDGTGSCRFTHALLEEAIYGVTPVAERARLHAQIAAALESEYANACDDHAEELARQLSGALGAADAGKLAYYHRVAGERALSAYAFPEAKAHFQAALAALPFFSCTPVHADLLSGLGKAERRLGDQEGAAEALTRAFALYMQAGATERARTLAAYPWGAFARSRDIRAVPEMYTSALDIAEKDTLNEAYILVNVVESSYYGGDERLQRDRLLRALDIAQRRNATELSVRILSCLMGVMELMVDGQAAPTYANMAMDLAGQLENPAVTCLAAQCVCRRDRILNIPVEEYRKHAQDHLNAATVLRDRLLMEDAHHECMQAAWVVADWKEMRRHVDAMSGLVGNSERNVFVRCRRASIELETGRIAEAKAELQRAVEIAAGPSVSRHERVALSAYLARYSWWLDESLWLSVAEAHALDARRLSASEPRTAYYAAQTLAMIAIIRGDRNAAQQWYQVFTRNSDDNNPRERCLIPAALAMTAGMKDAAIRHLEEGLQDTERRGNLYSRRWILYYLADVLLERNRPGDLTHALSVLEELLQIAERTGSVLVRDKATLLQAQVREALSLRDEARRPEDLTPRELEVLGLIVRGYTNSEIAEALFISPATAATHAYRILHKTGMANRAEVTAWAIRNGVVEA